VGRRVAVCQGSNAQQAVTEALKKLGDPSPRVMSFQNDSECFLALKTGKVDGWTNDTVILAGVSGGDRGFEAVGEIYSPTYYGIGVPRNQSAWRYRVNAALRSLIMDGTYQKIYDVWFGPEGRYPLPPASGRLPVWAE
jgi:polar amino acid transport system substrate-binding protein